MIHSSSDRTGTDCVCSLLPVACSLIPMTAFTRREFLAATAVAPLIPSVVPVRSSAATDARIEILLNEVVGRIAPEIQGHFTEHLGGVVYDGIWVGEARRFLTSAASGARSREAEGHQRPGDSVARWMFCRQLRLARRHRRSRDAADADQLLELRSQARLMVPGNGNPMHSELTSSCASVSSPAPSRTSRQICAD